VGSPTIQVYSSLSEFNARGGGINSRKYLKENGKTKVLAGFINTALST
jgi:hypothetical protein